MAVGDALSKNTTYGNVLDQVRLRTNTFDNPLLTDPVLIKETSLSVQKWAKILNGASAPFYLKTDATLTITGSANPYTVNLSGYNPFIDKIIAVTHITTGGTRTYVKMLSPAEAENVQKLTSLMASSIFGVHDGDSIHLYAGSSFTITTASDNVELKFYRQPICGTLAVSTVVSDTAWTAAADGVTISAFTGTLASHVGGTFTGLDNAAAPFSRTIVSYISSTSFKINATVAVGAGTNGYITPPSAASTAPTTATYLDIPDSFVPTVIDDVEAKVSKFKNGTSDQSLETSLERQRQDILTAYQVDKQTQK